MDYNRSLDAESYKTELENGDKIVTRWIIIGP